MDYKSIRLFIFICLIIIACVSLKIFSDMKLSNVNDNLQYEEFTREYLNKKDINKKNSVVENKIVFEKISKKESIEYNAISNIVSDNNTKELDKVESFNYENYNDGYTINKTIKDETNKMR